jgi:uncharacterized protein
MTNPTPRCPTCRREVAPAPGNAHAPFCSARCRTLDLGRWLDGAYAVPVGTPDEDDDGDAPLAGPPEESGG